MSDFPGLPSAGLPASPVVIEVAPQVRAGDLLIVTVRFATFTRYQTLLQLGCSPQSALLTADFRARAGGRVEWPLWVTLPIGESRCVVPLRAAPTSQGVPLPCIVTLCVGEETADLADATTWRAQAILHILA